MKRLIAWLLLASSIASAQSVQIGGHVTVSGNVTIASTPSITLTPGALAFGNVAQGTPSILTVTVSSTGGSPLVISSVVETGSADFGISTACVATWNPNTACVITVTFTPSALAARTGTITITDNAPGSPQTIGLTGTGISGGGLASGCGDPTIYDNLRCGNTNVASHGPYDLNTFTLPAGGTVTFQETHITAGNGTAITTCNYITPASGNYYVANDLACAAGSIAITVNHNNTNLDTNGKNIQGLIYVPATGDVTNTHIYGGGSVTCDTSASTNACIYGNNNGCYTSSGQTRIDFLTVQNVHDTGTGSGGTGNPWNIMWDQGGTSAGNGCHTFSTSPSLIVANITGALTNNNGNATRTAIAQVNGGTVLFAFNSGHIGSFEGSAQAFLGYASSCGSRILNNYVKIDLSAFSTTASTARAAMFDSAGCLTVHGLEIAGNDFDVADARGIRSRDSKNVYGHDNYIDNIRQGAPESATSLGAIHTGDADTNTTANSCDGSGNCIACSSAKAFGGQATDYATFTGATPSTFNEDATITEVSNYGPTVVSACGAHSPTYVSYIKYHTANVANYSTATSVSPLLSPTDVSNNEWSNNTLVFDCTASKTGIGMGGRAFAGDNFHDNKILTKGDCTTGFTGALMKIFPNNAFVSMTLQNTTGFASLGGTNNIVSTGATPNNDPAGNPAALNIHSTGTHDASGLWIPF